MPGIGSCSRLFLGILHDPVPGCFVVLLCIFKHCWRKCAFLNHMSMIVNDHNQDQNKMCSNCMVSVANLRWLGKSILAILDTLVTLVSFLGGCGGHPAMQWLEAVTWSNDLKPAGAKWLEAPDLKIHRIALCFTNCHVLPCAVKFYTAAGRIHRDMHCVFKSRYLNQDA